MVAARQKQESELILTASGLKGLYRMGGVAAFLQLAAILILTIVIATLGPKPTTAEEYFAIHQSSRVAAVLRGDFLLLILIGLYLGTFPALYMALRHLNPIATAMATLLTIIAVTLTFSSESTFSLLHLGDLYGAAETDAQRVQLLAAGEAVIATDMWHNSGAYMCGILLQGSGVMISLIMLRSKAFSKITAYSGLLGNGLDLIQHVLHPLVPGVSAVIMGVMGIFYLVWFPMLGRDLLRLSRKTA
ncbi:MAG: hypothetical protein QNJ45_12580 [Ardenticatenaceae bacterium]|nr:hypothetical protein [Ardenticatenaceae bacterium]